MNSVYPLLWAAPLPPCPAPCLLPSPLISHPIAPFLAHLPTTQRYIDMVKRDKNDPRNGAEGERGPGGARVVDARDIPNGDGSRRFNAKMMEPGSPMLEKLSKMKVGRPEDVLSWEMPDHLSGKDFTAPHLAPYRVAPAFAPLPFHSAKSRRASRRPFLRPNSSS